MPIIGLYKVYGSLKPQRKTSVMWIILIGSIAFTGFSKSPFRITLQNLGSDFDLIHSNFIIVFSSLWIFLELIYHYKSIIFNIPVMNAFFYICDYMALTSFAWYKYVLRFFEIWWKERNLEDYMLKL